jgi:lactate dehydrogenase-like 2-hydroxyacid dehydrogenase
MKPDLLLMQAMLGRTEKSMAEICEVQRLFAASDRDAFFESVAHRIRAVATGGMIGLSRKLMDRTPALEIIAVKGIGTDAVDLDEARRRGVRVTTTPDVLTDDVADMAMALMLATFRRLCEGDRFVRAGRWAFGGVPVARRVTGKRLGILGLGRIGRAIAHRARRSVCPSAIPICEPQKT